MSTSLDRRAARNLASTTKSRPQTTATSPRWLLAELPWKSLEAGTYRVNRRRRRPVRDGLVRFHDGGVVPGSLTGIRLLDGFTDAGELELLASLFEASEVPAGTSLASAGAPVDAVVLIVHGTVSRFVDGDFGEPAVIARLGAGEQIGAELLTRADARWAYSARAETPCRLLTLTASRLPDRPALRAHRPPAPERVTRSGEIDLPLSSGHSGEITVSRGFVDYDPDPREYDLILAQTRLRVHSRVADLYNRPMDQTGEQVRLVVEALREHQERDLLTHPDLGLIANVDAGQRVPSRTGRPTPADLDELLSRRRSTAFFLAHPRTIAAFRRQCTIAGIYPGQVRGHTAWRGVPILPSDKMPTSGILAMRTGEDDGGVVALRPAELPDQLEPGLSLRFQGIDRSAVTTYQLSAYCGVAVLVPDALGLLDFVEVGR